MTIATLIAAGRLDERLLGGTRERLADSGLAIRVAGWIESGSAIDLDIDGDGPAIRAALEGWEGVDIAPHPPRLHDKRLFVADMDSTMIGQECIDELADYAGVKAEVAGITERAMRGELDFVAALAERVALLVGLDQAAIGRCLDERVRPNPGARTLVRTLSVRGIRTVLVSGGFTAFANPVGTELGFDEVRANTLGLADGKLTGTTVGPIVDSRTKAEILETNRVALGLDAAQTMAIGDGANDAPMVAAAGFGVGYRPKPTLAAVADAVLLHHPLDALLWVLGIPRRDWII